MEAAEKIARLSQALQEPEGKYTHAQIRAKLNELVQSAGEPAVSGPGADVPEPQPEPQGGAGGSLPVRLGARALDAASFGMYDRGLNALDALTGHRTHFGVPPEQAAQDEQEHPLLAHTADAVGYVMPGTPVARTAEAAGKGVDALTNALVKRKLLTEAPGAVPTAARVAARGLAGAAKGSLTAGTTRGVEGVVAGEDPETAGRAAMDAASSPVAPVAGAALGGAHGAADEGARMARGASSDLRVLHKAGLEPGPVPGRPVIREDQPIYRQLPGASEPPLGVSTATPATRGAAARRAA